MNNIFRIMPMFATRWCAWATVSWPPRKRPWRRRSSAAGTCFSSNCRTRWSSSTHRNLSWRATLTINYRCLVFFLVLVRRYFSSGASIVVKPFYDVASFPALSPTSLWWALSRKSRDDIDWSASDVPSPYHLMILAWVMLGPFCRIKQFCLLIVLSLHGLYS